MFLIGSAFFTAMAMTLSLAVRAQSTVGAVLDAGGSQLSREEVSSLLSGASVSGPNANGNRTQADIKAGGEITGSFQRPDGKTGSYFGKWSVDDQGRFCRDIKVTMRNTSSTDSTCSFYFKAGRHYFIADTNERTAALYPRTVTRK